MKLSIAIRSCLLFGALALISGVHGCGGGDDGGTGTGGSGATGAAGNGGTGAQAGTSGQAGTQGNAGDNGTAGTGGSTSGRGGSVGDAGTTGNGMGNGGRGGNGMGNGGRGGTSAGGAGGRGGATGAAGRGGTGGGAAGGSGGAATFAQVAMILGTSCGTGDCHNGSQHSDLRNNTGLYSRIVNANPSGSRVMSSCTSRMLIVPNNVGTSVIAQAVMASVSGCTNARMPDECPSMRTCLTAAQISTITSWINAGAPM